MARQMTITDRKPAEKDATAFVSELVEDVNEWWRERGGGCAAVSATYENEVLTLQTKEGPSEITIDDVRAAIHKGKMK